MITFFLIIFNIFTIVQSSQVIYFLNKENTLSDNLYTLKLWNILYLCLSILGLMINFGFLYAWYGTATGKSISKADIETASLIDSFSEKLQHDGIQQRGFQQYGFQQNPIYY